MLQVIFYIFLSFIIYGAFYITFEVFFTAFSNSFHLSEKIGFKKFAFWGATSIYMFLVGGFAGTILSLILLLFQSWLITIIMIIPYIIIGGFIITLIELLSGLILNKLLKLNIWDYSMFKFNFLGQIELFHSIGWVGLSLIVYILSNILKYYILCNV